MAKGGGGGGGRWGDGERAHSNLLTKTLALQLAARIVNFCSYFGLERLKMCKDCLIMAMLILSKYLRVTSTLS